MSVISTSISAPLQLLPARGPAGVSDPAQEGGTSSTGTLRSDSATFSAEALALASSETEAATEEGSPADGGLTPEERKEVEKLKARDAEVRAHEQAHLSALGGLGGGVSYEYTIGPDGRRYAVAGEVPVRVGESPAGPEATIADAQKIARAALAPAEPSSADYAVHAKALKLEQKARQELREKEEKERNGEGDGPVGSISGAGPTDVAAQGLIDSATITPDDTGLEPGETDASGFTKTAESILNQFSS